MNPILLRGLLACLLLSSVASSQTIVNSGDDLAAMVAAASSGDVLEIHSNDTFVGSLVLNGKTITIQAGAGFLPTIMGPPGSLAVWVQEGLPATHCTLKDLLIGNSVWMDSSIQLGFAGTSQKTATLVMEDCVLSGYLLANGQGGSLVTGEFRNTQFGSHVYVYGGAIVPMDLDFQDCSFDGAFLATVSGVAVASSCDLSMRRCRFRAEARFQALAGGVLNFLVESCLVEKVYWGNSGIEVSGTPTGIFTNVTVSGFNTGIVGVPGVTWHNMLLFDNLVDLSNVAASEIDNSLIAGGDYDGVNGNFAASPVVDSDFTLLSCSPGIDAGSNFPPGLGLTDLFGAPRIQDNDGNFVQQINVGAVESTFEILATAVPEPASSNPVAYLSLVTPILGQNYTAFIASGAATSMTILAFGAASPPVTSPGWLGELLVVLNGSTIYDYGLFNHQIPIPSDCSLAGLVIRAQGFRIETSFGVSTIQCLNAIDLTLGTL